MPVEPTPPEGVLVRARSILCGDCGPSLFGFRLRVIYEDSRDFVQAVKHPPPGGWPRLAAAPPADRTTFFASCRSWLEQTHGHRDEDVLVSLYHLRGNKQGFTRKLGAPGGWPQEMVYP